MFIKLCLTSSPLERLSVMMQKILEAAVTHSNKKVVIKAHFLDNKSVVCHLHYYVIILYLGNWAIKNNIK